MISLQTARRLKAAGLEWRPGLNDFFAIPQRDMDDKIFVISDMLVTIDVLQDMQVVSFQGASEWALDSLVTDETVWMPREEQLREALIAALIEIREPFLRLDSGLGGCRCEISHRGNQLAFEDVDASEAYAAALHYLLQARST
jgi:hypothetical protein